MPPCMQTSVAPSPQASPARSATSSSDSGEGVGVLLRWANAQNRQPT